MRSENEEEFDALTKVIIHNHRVIMNKLLEQQTEIKNLVWKIERLTNKEDNE